jgi:hypothetical protein
LPTQDRSYRRHLEDQILSTLGAKSATFAEIVKKAGGAFPVEVRDSLVLLVRRRRVVHRGRNYSLARNTGSTLSNLPNCSDFYLRLPAPTDGVGYRPVRANLPVPHPADYDWRFTARALFNLMHLLLPVRKRSSRVALLGAPSLFLELSRTPTRAVLFDRNPALIAELRRAGLQRSIVRQDMFSKLPSGVGAFDVALADPPWYLEFYKAFILRASELLRVDGIFLLTMLPWLTRPNATEDRTEILRFAHEAGFRLFGVLPEFLEYETPHFEKVVLQHHDIQCVDWRRADLFLWVKIRRASPSAFRITKPQHDEWEDFALKEKIIKLRSRNQPPALTFKYKPVASESPVLRTVSRRWAHRSSIDVWTSDNEAYTVQGLEALRAVLRLTQAGESARQAISAVAARLHIDSTGANALGRFLENISGL